MLLTLDVGNTNTVLGIYQVGSEELLTHWRISTLRTQTADEYGVLFLNLFAMRKVDPAEVTSIIISSVVPPLDSTLRQVCERYFHLKAMFVEPGIKTGMPILVDNPAEVGADRLVNSVAAFHRYGGPCIVVDFGTATTFDSISVKGEYLGGVITPGLSISAEALFARAAKLSRVDVKKPAKVVGTNTVACIQSGLYYGYIGLVDGILERMLSETQRPDAPVATIIATGGLARLIADDSKYIKTIDDMLTLDGLRLIYERNRVVKPGTATPDVLVQNYFNYFTEIEEHFQRRRGSLLLLSTLDWALIETWREGGIPLAAVLKGIDAAFDKYDARKHKARVRRINGLAWCAQEVLAAMEDMREAAVGAASAKPVDDSFAQERIAAHLNAAAQQLGGFPDFAERLRSLATETLPVEELEQALTVLEEKLFALLLTTIAEADLLALKQQAAAELAPYRSRMPAMQIRQVEQQFLHKRLLEKYNLPRMSLFYMSQE